jgi:hypothetical protein
MDKLTSAELTPQVNTSFLLHLPHSTESAMLHAASAKCAPAAVDVAASLVYFLKLQLGTLLITSAIRS